MGSRPAPAPGDVAPALTRTASEAGLGTSSRSTAPRLSATIPPDQLRSWEDIIKDAPYRPKAFQQQIADAVIRRKDVLFIAPTGSGKGYVLYLLLKRMPRKRFIVLAPLVILVEELAKRLGEEAAYVTADNRTPALLAEIKSGKFRVVVLSPEMAASNAFRSILKEPSFQAELGAVIFDECQVLKDWAVDSSFRVNLKDVSIIRHMGEVPGVAMSGTLPASYRKEVYHYFELADPEVIDVGVDRPNIELIIAPIRYAMNSFRDILAWMPELHGEPPADEAGRVALRAGCEPTIIYINNKSQQKDLFHLVCEWYSRLGLRDAVLLVSADMSVSHRSKIKALIEDGGYLCAVSTSALGMGSDMPSITRVIQWRVNDSLAAIMQRLGRAGRNPSTSAQGVILVDPAHVPDQSTEGHGANELGEDEAQADAVPESSGVGQGSSTNRIHGESEPGKSKAALDADLMRVIRRAMSDEGCVREVVNELLGQPPADKVPAPEEIFGPLVKKDAPCCSGCNPRPWPELPEHLLGKKPADERARVGITKLQEHVGPLLREWRLSQWNGAWAAQEDASNWLGIAYFLQMEEVDWIVKNLGKIDHALAAGKDDILLEYLAGGGKATVVPELTKWLKKTIGAYDAVLEEARQQESREAGRQAEERGRAKLANIAEKKAQKAAQAAASGSSKRINRCSKCTKWNAEHPDEEPRPVLGHIASSKACLTNKEEKARSGQGPSGSGSSSKGKGRATC